MNLRFWRNDDSTRAPLAGHRALTATVAGLLCSAAALAQSPHIAAVDEYVPAPGQFVNTLPEATEADTPATMAQKCSEAIAQGAGGLVTLGACGGYIVFHFDHPIANVEGQPDFAVWGNAFENNAEPAVVSVAIDQNHNGLPDDEWFELRGSEYDNPLTVRPYHISYAYSPLQDVVWTDSRGQSGTVPRNKYHRQEYFPLWLSAQGELAFQGTLLPQNAQLVVADDGTSMWQLPAFEYGYADNLPNTDRMGCSFDINWAVTSAGLPANLAHIDFVRCQNAMNQVCGSIGETSTEISGAEDLHLEASLQAAAIGTARVAGPRPATTCDLLGRPATGRKKGVVLVRMADGTVLKRLSAR